MISSATSMGGTLYKISSKSNNLGELDSPSFSFSANRPHRKISHIKLIKNNLSSTIVDLIKQSKLKKNSRVLYEQNYFFNLLKIKLKKKYQNNNFPPIKTFSSLKKIQSINYNTLHTITNINFINDKYIKAFSHENIKRTKKNNTLNKNIINKNQNSQDLKVVYVNKFLKSQIKRMNKTEENYNEDVTIKNRFEDKYYNFNKSKMFFFNHHGIYKKNRRNKNMFNSTNKKISNKYEGLNSIKIRQHFLKRKLGNVNSKMNLVQKDVENTKMKINNLYTRLNKDIQLNLDEEFNKT